MNKMMLAFILMVVAGIVAGVFTPDPLRGAIDRALPVLLGVSLLWSLGLFILAKRLPRRDVSSIERWLRDVFFVKRT